jgi:hypothetical protein
LTQIAIWLFFAQNAQSTGIAVYSIGPIVGALLGGALAIELGDRDNEEEQVDDDDDK